MKLIEIYSKCIFEDYPQFFNIDEFKKIKSFRGKIQYAKEKLGKPIGKGTGRMVFKIDDTKVLKLAINRKGQAQNAVEAKWGRVEYFDNILAKVFDYDEDYNLWIEMELARKVTIKEVEKYIGISLSIIYDYLQHLHYRRKNRPSYIKFTNQERDELENNEFISKLCEFIDHSELMYGDLPRKSTWGKVIRNGEEVIVIVDYGNDETTINAYY